MLPYIVPPLRISPSFANHEASSERNVPTWWLQISAVHMHEVLRKVSELVFISGVLRGSYISGTKGEVSDGGTGSERVENVP